MEDLLSIKNLSISFAQNGETTYAVNNISFSILPNEIVAIVGESGSGKSITSLSILNLLPKNSSVKGNIFYTHHDKIIDLASAKKQSILPIRGNSISMIFQEPMTSLNPVITCGNQVMETLVLHKNITKKEAKLQTIKLFEQVKLPNPIDIIDRYPHELSGGQKQRVMIAMAISCNPTLLIADEPTTALDVTVQKTILDLLKNLQQQNNMSVMLITHDLGIVADFADKIIVLYKGEIVEQGLAKNILQQPQHWYTKALLACKPSNNAKEYILPTINDFKNQDTINPLFSPIKRNTTNIDTLSLPTVLSVENLKVYYKQKKKLFDKPSFYKAVDDVSFEVKKGETVGLVGESGCGKTTLSRAILQLTKATDGKIVLNGTDITKLSHQQLRTNRKNIQIVFQDPYGSLNPRQTIGNSILEPLQVHQLLQNTKTRKDAVVDLLEKVNLPADAFNRYPHQFSGGQRQRICIARALALNPSFLIFDESVSALDVSVQAQILNLLNELKRKYNYTAIFISHDLSVVHYISDRILVMQHGKIVEQGNANNIYHNPQHPYSQQLINSIPGKQLRN